MDLTILRNFQRSLCPLTPSHVAAIVVSNIVAAAMLEKLGCSQVVVVVTKWELHVRSLAPSSLLLPRLIENPYNSESQHNYLGYHNTQTMGCIPDPVVDTAFDFVLVTSC
jgi:hypothetical protein